MTPAEFLTTLWGNPPPGKALVWTLPEKRSIWYDRFDTVDEDMRTHDDDEVYTGVGIAPQKGVRLTSRNRLKEGQVVGIPGLWADIDVDHPVHKRAPWLPPDREQAIDAIGELPFRPTVLVDSGHGLQAWWLFKEPWLFSCPEERDLARRAAQWWHRTIQGVFAQHEWTLDATFDLARVMRLPGTWNNKDAEDRRRVEVVEQTGQRCSREDLLNLVPQDFEATKMGSKNGGGGNTRRSTPPGSQLVLNPDAAPHLLMMETLLDLDPHFRRSWEHNRPDLPDQSPSGYDMSLASRAVQAEWSDQEVVDLLIAFRRKHGLPSKLRADYYERTLAKAKRPIVRQRVVREALDQAARFNQGGDNQDGDNGRARAGPDGEAGNPAGAEGTDEDDRRASMLETLSKLFEKFTVLDIQRFGGRTTTYVMTTDQGTVYLGSTKDVLSQSRFTERVAGGTRQVLNLTLGRGRWAAVAQLFLDACVDRDMAEVASPESELAAWVDMYLLDRGVLEDKHDAAAEQAPLLNESRIHIHLYAFRGWLHTQLGIPIAPEDLVQTLTEAGWGYERLNVYVGGHRTTYRTWRCGEDYQREDD